MAFLKQLTQRLVLSGIVVGSVAAAPGDAAAEDARADAPRSRITTQGYGEVRVRPDALRASVGVEVEAATLDKARSEVNTKMQAVLRSLKALSVTGMTLQTQALQFSPIYDERERPPKITGYRALNQVTVTVIRPATDLGDAAAQIIDAALKGGANRAGDVSFYLDDATAAHDSALAEAVKDASRNAASMAHAAGVRVIKLVALEQGGSFRPGALRFNSLRFASEATTPVETGEVVITSSVTARFLFGK